MNRTARLLGSALSLLGTLFQLLIVDASVPGMRLCFGCREIGPDPTPPEAVDTWRPFVENPGAGLESGRREPRCPEPQGRGFRYHLDAAPLPGGYDPHAYGERRLYACVLVDPAGEVLGARMIRGTGQTSLDRNLLRIMRRSWRFRPTGWAEERASWQRLRLNSGAVDGSVWEPRIII